MAERTLYLNNPPPEIVEKIETFFVSSGTEINWADSEGDAALSLFWPGEKTECDESRLYSGGFMTCPVAFKATSRLGIDRAIFGEFLNLLDIKLRQCQFGCF